MPAHGWLWAHHNFIQLVGYPLLRNDAYSMGMGSYRLKSIGYDGKLQLSREPNCPQHPKWIITKGLFGLQGSFE